LPDPFGDRTAKCPVRVLLEMNAVGVAGHD
jgi:hypothetical protein